MASIAPFSCNSLEHKLGRTLLNGNACEFLLRGRITSLPSYAEFRADSCPSYSFLFPLIHMATWRYWRTGLLFVLQDLLKKTFHWSGWCGGKKTDWDVRWSRSPALPFSSSVTLGPSLHSPKPCSTATNMVFNLLQLDISLWGCIWLMANIWWRQSFRQGLDVLSTSNIQTLGNSEMIKVFIQMLIWLSGNNPDVWVIYKSLWGLFKESFCESLQRVYLECLTWKFKFWFLKTYDLGFFKTTHCSPAWYIVAVFLLFPVHCLHWLCVHVHLCASFS